MAWTPNRRQIEKACERIRKGWTDLERRRRFVGPQEVEFEFPCVSAREFSGVIDEWERECGEPGPGTGEG
jgi:hypothetical protein